MDQFIILGSANAVPKPGQDNTHLVIQAGDKLIMVDCGDNPIAKMIEAGFSILDVTDLVLTHFHADHVGSLPLLIMGMWLEKRHSPLAIHGLGVTLEKAEKLLDLFNWRDWNNMFPVTFHAVPDEGAQAFIGGREIQVTALPVTHLIPTIGLRAEFSAGRVIAYTCDSEPCDGVDILARGADVLLHEAAGEAKGHSSAAQAGKSAAKGGVRKLVLIHYDNRLPEAELIAAARQYFSGEVALARDMMAV